MARKGERLSAETRAKITGRPRIMNANKTREQNQEAGRKGASIRWAAQREMIANG